MRLYGKEMEMNIYESSENYLEAILMLRTQNGSVRSIDVANHLGFSKPSVSVAMKRLRENGYIDIGRNGQIVLMPSGQQIAERIFERHQTLTTCFISLGVDEKTAAADACKVEHDLSDETFQKLKEHIMKHAGQ